ncbi:ATP-binding cassette domain-containing protein [Verrucomicrobia bacterium S94]|nr:ATP-binding cassette domain-containing protein [Verrucomicrobia bacterium S94]
MASEINRIRDQFQSGLWPQFVEHIELENLRSWKQQGVNFKFPVTAVVGENGTGKSTLLKALACAYENPVDVKKSKRLLDHPLCSLARC